MSTPIHCLVVSANQVTSPYPVYPIGAACLVDSLQRHGHRADHFDLLADGGLQGLRETLRRQQFDLIALSIRNLDSVDSADPRDYLGEAQECMGCIRQESTAPVVIGGPAFSVIPEPFMQFLRADYGIVGEGEVLLCRLADRIGDGNPPRSRIFAAAPELHGWGSTALNRSTVDWYLDHGGMLNVQTKRGCPHGCSYCSYPTIEGQDIRCRDPREVVEEVIRLKEEYGARYLFFTDSVFNDPKGHYLEVAEELVRRKVEIPWCGFFRPAGIGRKQISLLKRAGLAAMELGTDASSDRTLKGLNKTFRFDEVVRLQEELRNAEIPAAHFVMFGGPNETRETLAEGLANLERLEGCVVFGFIGIRILPGTGIHVRSLAEGQVEPGSSLLKPVYYIAPGLTREEIENMIIPAFGDRMDRIYPAHEFDARVATLHKMGHIGPLWDFILRENNRKR